MQKAPNALTRKAGPLPVWGWALLALVALFLYMRSAPAKASGGAGLPYTPTSGSGAQQPASGQGNAADNGSADLLSALGDNALSYDALLSALQTSGGGYGATSGTGSGSGDTSAVTAPTVTASPDPGTTPTAQSDPAAVAAAGDVPYTGPLSNGDPGYVIDPTTGQVYGPSTAIDGGIRQRVGQPVEPDAVDRYLANKVGYDVYSGTFAGAPQQSYATAAVGPTPTAVVQPAPVDTGGSFTPTVGYTTYTQRPVSGQNVAV